MLNNYLNFKDMNAKQARKDLLNRVGIMGIMGIIAINNDIKRSGGQRTAYGQLISMRNDYREWGVRNFVLHNLVMVKEFAQYN